MRVAWAWDSGWITGSGKEAQFTIQSKGQKIQADNQGNSHQIKRIVQNSSTKKGWQTLINDSDSTTL